MADPFDREQLGQVVRRVWVLWATTQENPKPNWLVPWADLDEASKEADRTIGDAILRYVRTVDSLNTQYATLKGAQEGAATVDKPAFEGYAFVHLMGHKTVVGYVHEETLFGTALIAVDVPAHGEQAARTDYYGPQSLYHLEPTTEEQVQAFYAPRPRLALPAARRVTEEEYLQDPDAYETDEEDDTPDGVDDEDDDDDDDEDEDMPVSPLPQAIDDISF
jgi:hypothetical protein